MSATLTLFDYIVFGVLICVTYLAFRALARSLWHSRVEREAVREFEEWTAECERILKSLPPEEQDEINRRWESDIDWIPPCFPPRPTISK